MANEVTKNKIYATVGPFIGKWTISGGAPDRRRTEYLEMGEQVAKDVMGSVKYSDITLTKTYKPEEDGLIEAWAESAERGVNQNVVVTKYAVDPSGLVPRAVASYDCQYVVLTPPDGTRDDSVSEISLTLSVNGKVGG